MEKVANSRLEVAASRLEGAASRPKWRPRRRGVALLAVLALGAAFAAGAVYLRGGVSRLAAEWPMSDVPAPAGLEPGFAGRTRAADGSAEALLCTGSTDDAPEVAMSRLRAALESGGWEAVPPDPGMRDAALYARGRAVAFAHASRGTDGSTRWLLLRREVR